MELHNMWTHFIFIYKSSLSKTCGPKGFEDHEKYKFRQICVISEVQYIQYFIYLFIYVYTYIYIYIYIYLNPAVPNSTLKNSI